MYCRLLRAVGIRRRCRGDPFRWVDAVSTKRREFSYSAKRLVTTALLMLGVVHYFACLLWWTVRLQGYPDSESCPLAPFSLLMIPGPIAAHRAESYFALAPKLGACQDP